MNFASRDAKSSRHLFPRFPVTIALPCRRVVERGHYAITIEEGVPALGQEMQGLKQMLADFEHDLGALQVNAFLVSCRL